jgi:hypothetical protein
MGEAIVKECDRFCGKKLGDHGRIGGRAIALAISIDAIAKFCRKEA